MYAKTHFIYCEDAQICCYESGTGVPIVLLHGNGEDSTYWKNQVPVLVRMGFRVLAMDSRGHGKSEPGTRGLSFDLFADDLKMVLDTMNVPKAHIAGFSDGGNLAIKFALKFPQYVDKLVLNGANIEMFKGVKAYTQLPLYPVVGILALAGKRNPAARQKHDVLALMTRGYGVSWDDLRQIEASALVIVGEHDMIRDAHSCRIAETLPNGEYLCLGGTSHFCAMESPARFNLALLRFLRQTTATA